MAHPSSFTWSDQDHPRRLSSPWMDLRNAPRNGMDGTLTGGPMYADVYAYLWELHLAGKVEEIREVHSKLLLMTNLEQVIPGMRSYMMKHRGVFKTTISRRADYSYAPDAVAEIEYNFAALKPYLRA